MQTLNSYDIIGIGIGPFNLGLAVMAAGVPGLRCLFIDRSQSFCWHPGLLLDRARLQVPFLADLVTAIDPCSRYTYLAYLHARKRLFRFAIREQYFPTRKEYNDYCRWVTTQLPGLCFGRTCLSITWDKSEKMYRILTADSLSGAQQIFHARHVVLGTGTVPWLPPCAAALKSPRLVHSSDYLLNRSSLLAAGNIAVIGSGQSAAEIFSDLQHETRLQQLHWFTRSARFFPMEYSRLSLEMTSPDYIDYFFHLPQERKIAELRQQDALYKGISFSLVNEIYDGLYLRSIGQAAGPETSLHAACDLKDIRMAEDGVFTLSFLHAGSGDSFEQQAAAVIMATGYRQFIPAFLQPLTGHIRWTEGGNYDIRRNYSISRDGASLFVQNADLHTHGFNSADLGMGPYRNAVILNTILGRAHFVLETEIAFQTFGVPGSSHSFKERPDGADGRGPATGEV